MPQLLKIRVETQDSDGLKTGLGSLSNDGTDGKG
jgi:hypothetical protein